MKNNFYKTINEFKKSFKINENTNDILYINLVDKYKKDGSDIEIRNRFEKFKNEKIEGFKDSHSVLNISIGDYIEFNGGYNNDIRYTAEILGFDKDNDIYILWESYWYPIKNDNKRNIKVVNINENVDNDTNTDISLIEDSLPSERWSGNWFTDFFVTKNNDKIYVGIVVGGKRGYPRDAYIKALKTPKPSLPKGFTYTTGTPVNMYTNEPVTLKSIKEDDEYYDDRGYTDSEFNGEVYYEVTKTTNESNIIYENIDTTTIPKALEDIDERRPNRMKRPTLSDYNPWNGRGGDPYSVYIQDEAEAVMQDKYGRERGTRNWEASIGHGARGGAMFKMADNVMKEKQFLFKELNLMPKSYWDYSYFALWKMWMDKIGQPYKIDSDADVQAKKDAKEQAEQEAKRLAKDKQLQDNKNKLTTKLNNIRDKYSALNLDKFTPDAKDRKRIEDLINNNRSTSSTLANKMARSITNKVKAIKRGLAAIEYYENLTDIDSLTYLYAEDVIKPFFDKAMLLNESCAINEGQFSWLTQDTNTQIGSESHNKISVYMYDNKGNKWHEPDYEGYGVFGGKDFFDLTAEMNGYSDERQFGIDLTYGKIQTKNEDGILLFPALVEDSNYDISKHDFTIQPENDPNQGWFMYDDEDDMYESKLFTSINEFKQYLKINERIEDKDWKRMKDLIQKNSEGEGVASTLKSKSKVINRFVAGLLLSDETDIIFDLKYNEIINKENEYSNLPFKEFGNKALQLGATIEEIQDIYDNTEIPQKYKELTDYSYLSKKQLNSWVTGKVSKAILDAGYDINYLNKGGNAITIEGKDAMRRSGRAWTIGYRTEIIANGKTYKLDFDAITSEGVDDTKVLYVLAYSSDSIFTSKMIEEYKEYGIREFTKKIIETIKNDNEN